MRSDSDATLRSRSVLCMNCRLQHIDYMLLKLCSLEKVCYRYTVGQLLWCDAAVFYCTISIIFGCEHGLTRSERITLVWVMPCWRCVRTKDLWSFSPAKCPSTCCCNEEKDNAIRNLCSAAIFSSGFGFLEPLKSNIYKNSFWRGPALRRKASGSAFNYILDYRVTT